MLSLTIGDWISVGVILVVGIIGTLFAYGDSGVEAIIIAAVTVIVVIGMIIGFNWYHTSTASGIRGYKDFTSEMSNGIEREITITAEDGREIFHYEGKIDLDMENGGNYLRFETQDGKRYNVEYGIQDTVIVVEK